MITYSKSLDAEMVDDWGELANAFIDSPKDGVFYIPDNGLCSYVKVSGIEFLKRSSYILVGFSGAVSNKGLESGPFFSFLGVSKEIEVPLISFSDPSLMLSSSLTLGWHLGNRLIPDYKNKVSKFLDDLSLALDKKVILAGGSGGGFASLNISNLMEGKERVLAFVWNPQVVISSYYKTAVDRYVDACWEEKDRQYIEGYRVKCNDSKAVFLMDGLDHMHIRSHLKKYLATQGKPVKINGYYLYENSSVLIGDWGKGHTAPPKKLIVRQLKEVMKNWFDFSSYKEVRVSKTVVDFSSDGVFPQMRADAKPTVSIVSRMVMIDNEINKKYIGYQLRYEVVNEAGDRVFSSSWLKNYHNCRVFCSVSEKEKKI